MIIGFTRDEVLGKLDELNGTKYEQLYTQERNSLIAQFGNGSIKYIEQFFLWYIDTIVPQMLADLIDANNKKINDDIQKLISKDI
jgi:hypothetical protein